MKIDNQTIVVTGGASGLGLAYAVDLTYRGANVWAIDRNQKALEDAREAQKTLSDERASETASSGRLQFLECDISQEEEVQRVVAEIGKHSEGIDVLVNNAAVLRDQALVSKLGRTIKKHSLSDWKETLESNLTGTFLMAREVAERMIRDKRPGLIVNTSSISRNGNPGQTAYSATKAAIDAMTVTWSQELAIYKIRVVALAPGFVETSMTEQIPSLFLDQIRKRTPLKRYGTLDEAAHTLRYLIENEYFNGKTLEWDGGLRF